MNIINKKIVKVEKVLYVVNSLFFKARQEARLNISKNISISIFIVLVCKL